MVHFSGVLRTRHRAVYHYKRQWRLLVEKQKLGGPIVPQAYLDAGVKIINAAAEQKELENAIEGHFDWKPDHPMFRPAVGDGPENPRYNEIPARIFRRGTQLAEGLEQAQVLTKTVVVKGVPPVWEYAANQIKSLRFEDEDERGRRCVMQSVRWDPSDLELPKRVMKYGHLYPKYWGITLQKANDLICQNLLRLTELTFSGNPQILTRHLAKNALVNVTYEPARPTDSRIVFNCNNALMLTDTQQLPAFFTPEQVNLTKETKLPSLYPLKPTLNLDEVQVYDWETAYPFLEGFKHAMPHTIFVQHNSAEEWTLAQKQSKALIHSHATLAALARRLYGADVGVLPRPLSIQCVLADRGRHFTFYAYQLNTLDMADQEGVKNQAWVDTDSSTAVVDDVIVTTDLPYTLFSLADQMEGLMGYQMYTEKQSVQRYPIRLLNTYNPAVMEKLLTLYATHLHLGHHHQQQQPQGQRPADGLNPPPLTEKHVARRAVA
ncbi:putative 39S ribosomal protein L37, mitochondrial [Hypsibius exemplaris]|uniref:39S ribosomal protein L37, mitochondrial n=1 Tax=Hypsibius exemplaris TaxID=2072580 RepID=A0A1W0WJX3_HYPEX|nr:putative 39S ribosomal protein L37, mitochondrial [Hypsibius exemplaris]